MVLGVDGALLQLGRDVSGDDVVQEPVRLVLQVLDLSPVLSRQQGTVEADPVSNLYKHQHFIKLFPPSTI